jgi:hypothetical protein
MGIIISYFSNRRKCISCGKLTNQNDGICISCFLSYEKAASLIDSDDWGVIGGSPKSSGRPLLNHDSDGSATVSDATASELR